MYICMHHMVKYIYMREHSNQVKEKQDNISTSDVIQQESESHAPETKQCKPVQLNASEDNQLVSPAFYFQKIYNSEVHKQ